MRIQVVLGLEATAVDTGNVTAQLMYAFVTTVGREMDAKNLIVLEIPIVTIKVYLLNRFSRPKWKK